MPVERSKKHRFDGPFASDEIAERFRGSAPEGAINYARRHKLKLFVPDIVDVIVASRDLGLLNRATVALSELANEQFMAWDAPLVATWWKNRSSEYPRWPFEEYTAGVEAFGRANYPESSAWFDSVLQIDPSADKSRALAIASYCEMGELDRAKDLAKLFAEGSGRWKAWADAKLQLAEHQPTAATDALIEMLRGFPTFRQRAYLASRTNVWSGVEWDRLEAAVTSESLHQ